MVKDAREVISSFCKYIMLSLCLVFMPLNLLSTVIFLITVPQQEVILIVASPL